jgi:hypothetical protein
MCFIFVHALSNPAEINVCWDVVFLSFPDRQYDIGSFFRTIDSLVPIYNALLLCALE